MRRPLSAFGLGLGHGAAVGGREAEAVYSRTGTGRCGLWDWGWCVQCTVHGTAVNFEFIKMLAVTASTKYSAVRITPVRIILKSPFPPKQIGLLLWLAHFSCVGVGCFTKAVLYGSWAPVASPGPVFVITRRP